MKEVRIKGITPNYPIDGLGIETLLCLKEGGSIFNDEDLERKATGAKVTKVEHMPDEDIVTFRISDSDAEVWLARILRAFRKRCVTISEVTNA